MTSSETNLLYHYTDGKGLLGILDSKSIWATHFRYLNDSKEFSYGIDLIKEELLSRKNQSDDEWIKMLCAFTEECMTQIVLNLDLYIACFSEKFDDLGQWMGYAGSTDAYALGFVSQHLKSLFADAKYQFGKCIYTKVDQKRLIQQSIDRMLSTFDREDFPDADLISEDEVIKVVAMERMANKFTRETTPLVEQALFFKDPAFENESEWRVVSHGKSDVKFRVGSSMIVPYRKIAIDMAAIESVSVGPTPHPELALKSVRMLLESKNMGHVETVPSKIPYRNW